MADDATHEQTLYVCRDGVKVFSIPAVRGADGRVLSAEWRVDACCFTGRLRLLARGDHAEIRLEDANRYEAFTEEERKGSREQSERAKGSDGKKKKSGRWGASSSSEGRLFFFFFFSFSHPPFPPSPPTKNNEQRRPLRRRPHRPRHPRPGRRARLGQLAQLRPPPRRRRDGQARLRRPRLRRAARRLRLQRRSGRPRQARAAGTGDRGGEGRCELRCCCGCLCLCLCRRCCSLDLEAAAGSSARRVLLRLGPLRRLGAVRRCREGPLAEGRGDDQGGGGEERRGRRRRRRRRSGNDGSWGGGGDGSGRIFGAAADGVGDGGRRRALQPAPASWNEGDRCSSCSRSSCEQWGPLCSEQRRSLCCL